MYFSSASKELRALLTPAARQQLRTDYEAATALCHKAEMRSCKQLREAKVVAFVQRVLSSDDLALLGTLGSVLPALEELRVCEPVAGPDGVQRLAEKLRAGALLAVTLLSLTNAHVGVSGASALAAALGRGALPRLKCLYLDNTAIGDAGLVALAPALRRRPALERLYLRDNPFGDEGLAALVAPPPAAGAQPPPTAGFAIWTCRRDEARCHPRRGVPTALYVEKCIQEFTVIGDCARRPRALPPCSLGALSLVVRGRRASG